MASAKDRKPKLRPNYKADAKYLRRLAVAVEQDETGTMNQRMHICSLLSELAELFEDM
jgi:hypothetical protein